LGTPAARRNSSPYACELRLVAGKISSFALDTE
jgi:hypothetical protein